MPSWTRLAVCFKRDCPPDVGQIHDCLRRVYRIGYCGLYELEDSLCLYIQTMTKQARIAPAKLYCLCKPFGATALPKTYKFRDGILLAEKGQFRHAGGCKASRIQASTPSIVNNINKTIIHGDQINQYNDNREIHIHMNALGCEDVSHIKMEQFKNLFHGSTDEIIDFMKGFLSENVYRATIENAWHGLQNTLYKKKCSKEHEKTFRFTDASASLGEVAATDESASPGKVACTDESASSGQVVSMDESAFEGQGAPSPGQVVSMDASASPGQVVSTDASTSPGQVEDDAASSASSDTDSESDYTGDGPAYDKVVVNGALIKYDSDPRSEYNKIAKEKVGRISICDLRASAAAVELPAEFAKLLMENVSNCNVLHGKNAGYFEYFDGSMWVKQANNEVDTLLSTWANKIKECFQLLGERHGADFLDSYEADFALNVMVKFKYRHLRKSYKRYMDTQAKRAALFAIDNANSRIKAVQSQTGKRLRRVYSDDEGQARKRKVHRNVVWAELMK